VPAGFTRYEGTKLGFEIALAPGWIEASSDPGSGATGAVLFDLTGGSGVGGSRVTAATLAGRSAKRVAGRFTGLGAVTAIEAYVMLESGRAWTIALVGPPDAVDHSQDDFEKMASTFSLVGARPAPAPRAAVSLPAPGFTELDPIKGPVVINFFATWCVECRTEMPLIAKRADSSQGRFSLLGVECCGDNRSAVPGFLNGLGVQSDFRLLAYDDDGHVARVYGLLGPPTTFFLDKDHVLQNLVIGPLTASTLDAGIRAAAG